MINCNGIHIIRLFVKESKNKNYENVNNDLNHNVYSEYIGSN